MSNPELIKAYAEWAWPLLAAVILFALLPTVVRVARSRAFTVKFGEMEVSVKDASEQFQRDIRDLQQQVLKMQDRLPALAEAAELSESARLTRPRARAMRLILWVDDNPKNNASVISSLQAEGYDVTMAESTEEALSLLKDRKLEPAVIVSDMARREGLIERSSAGLDLIRALRASGLKVPVYIYTSARSADSYHKAVSAVGGNGITASTTDLLRMIRSAVT